MPVEEMRVSPLPAPRAAASGTTVLFTPDEKIFKTGTEFDLDTLSTRFDEQAYLNAGLNITVIDERQVGEGEGEEPEPTVLTFCHLGGICEYVSHICESKKPLFDEPTVVAVSSVVRGVSVDVAMRWNSDMYTDNLLGFANGVNTIQGGTHIDGLKAATTRVLNAQARHHTRHHRQRRTHTPPRAPLRRRAPAACSRIRRPPCRASFCARGSVQSSASRCRRSSSRGRPRTGWATSRCGAGTLWRSATTALHSGPAADRVGQRGGAMTPPSLYCRCAAWCPRC